MQLSRIATSDKLAKQQLQEQVKKLNYIYNII